MTGCNFTDEDIAASLNTDNFNANAIREGSKNLLRAIWKNHPDRMRNLFYAGRVHIPEKVNPGIVKKPKVIRTIPSVANQLAKSVACDLDVTIEQLRSPSRMRKLVVGRAIMAQILIARGWSQSKIAGAIGRSDHTTVGNLLLKFDFLIGSTKGAKTCYKRNLALFGPAEKENG